MGKRSMFPVRDLPCVFHPDTSAFLPLPCTPGSRRGWLNTDFHRVSEVGLSVAYEAFGLSILLVHGAQLFSKSPPPTQFFSVQFLLL